MSTDRSRIYQRQLPGELEAALRSAGLRPQEALLCVQTDLSLLGRYEPVFLVLEADRLYTVAEAEGPALTGPAGNQQAPVRILLNRADIREIRTRQGIGGGFVEALVDGVYVEVLAYSNTRAETLHKAVAKLKDWLDGQTPEVGPADDLDPRTCPKCGMALEFRGDICRRCVDRGAVLGRVLKLMRPYAGKAVVAMSLVMVGIGLSLIPQQLIRIMINKVLAPQQAGNPVLEFGQAVHLLLLLVGALLGTYAFGAVVAGTAGRFSSFVGTQITFDMRAKVFNHLTCLGVGFYDRYNVGQLLTRVASDTEQMKGFVNQLTSGFLAQIITVLAVGAVLFTLSWKLALLTLLPAPLVVCSALFFWKRIYPRYYRVWDANSKLYGVLNTILSGIRVVKAFGQEPREQKRFERSSSYVRDSFRRVEYTVSAFNPSMSLLLQLGGVIVWFVGGRQVLRGQLLLGDLIAFLGYLWMFYAPLGSLTQLTNWLTGFLTASQRTFEILDTAPQVADAASPKTLERSRGGVEFRNVTFGYQRHEPVLKGVSLEIEPGEHVGVVGKSGSGKTTLVNLIARFYDADEGSVLIDGVDVRELKLADLRRSVGTVLQEPFLFRGTIYANITYGRGSATPDEVLTAAKAANAHGFIMRHPLGYDTYIGERGAGLSGGERQRISIARALLYDPPILILDEATSSVDTESEQLIQSALQRVTKGRTTVSIAHRLSTLRQCDRILVVDRGVIAEQGSHDELLELRGLYWRLVKIQTELSRDPSVDALNFKAK